MTGLSLSASIDARDLRMLQLRDEGYRNRDIAKQLGLCRTVVSGRLSAIDRDLAASEGPEPHVPTKRPLARGLRLACAAPGCDRSLDDRNTSAVCRDHNHLAGYCRCKNCLS